MGDEIEVKIDNLLDELVLAARLAAAGCAAASPLPGLSAAHRPATATPPSTECGSPSSRN